MKHQSYIRSLFVAFCAFFVCTSALAETVHLNPFAYRIDSVTINGQVFNKTAEKKEIGELWNDNLVINYRLSGDADAVAIRLWDVSTGNWSKKDGNAGCTRVIKYTLADEFLDKYTAQGELNHTYTIDFTDYVGQLSEEGVEKIQNMKLRWTIDVQGGNQQGNYSTNNGYNFINAELVTQNHNFRYPGSVDICNDPYSYNFAAIFCTESRAETAISAEYDKNGNFSKLITKNYDDPSYISYDETPGVYVFGGGMEHLKTKYKDNRGKRYSVGDYDQVHFRNGANGVLTALAPYRVRVAEDGRVFVSSAEGSDKILYEITNPSNLRESNFYTPNNSGGSYQKIFNGGTWVLEQLRLLSGSDFIAAPNVGMDTYGKGKNLRILLLSANTKDMPFTPNSEDGFKNKEIEYPGINQNQWNLSEYNIGGGNTWSTKSSKEYLGENALEHKVVGTSSNGTTKGLGDGMLVGYNWTNIEYDPNGGFWICQYRGTNPVAGTLMHYNIKTGKFDLEEHKTGRNAGGVRHNYDYTKLVVPGGIPTGNKTTTYKQGGTSYTVNWIGVEEKQLTVYTMEYPTSGTYTIKDSAYIDASIVGGVRDLAWDFADNLYIVGDHKLAAYRLPHQGKTVSTPCREEYHFTLAPIYDFNVAITPANYATITHERIGKAPYPHYLHNAKMDLRADVVAGCKFYQWTGQSTGTTSGTDGCKLLINSLTKNEAITANVGLCVYEDTKILGMTSETIFPAAFVKRELDDISYSTICLPFHLESLEGTPYQGASVLELKSSTVNSDGDNRVFLNFEEVDFGAGERMEAGKPYLIQLPKGKQLQSEEIFTDVTCPVLSGTNACGGLDVNCNNGITFHALLNPTTFTADQLKDMLFLTADNRLVTLYGQNSVSINGLRGYFTVSGGMSKNAEFVLNLPDKVVTSTPFVGIEETQQPTKYMQNGQLYIQQGEQVYNMNGALVK
jgi:hypothetical protein